MDGSVRDPHATMLYLLGRDQAKLTGLHNDPAYHLTEVAGEVIRKILA